jgi:WD40 repeat protein
VAFSPDGKLILTGSDDCTACLWEASSGKELSHFQGHTGWVNSVAFSPDGKLILTGSFDGTARLWESSSGRELSCFQGHTDWVTNVSFSPDGSLAVTCDKRGWVFFWHVDDLGAKDPLALYVAYYPVLAVDWRDKRHVVLADNGGPRNFPYFYDLELEGMG